MTDRADFSTSYPHIPRPRVADGERQQLLPAQEAASIPFNATTQPPLSDAGERNDARIAELAELLRQESASRARQGRLGRIAFWAATAWFPIAQFAEQQQTALPYHPLPTQGGDLQTLLAAVPWDWKATSVVAGTFAATYATARIRRNLRFPEERQHVVSQIAASDQFVPLTPKQAWHNRLKSRLLWGAATVAAGAAAYVLGEHGSNFEDYSAGAGLWALTGMSWLASKHRAAKQMAAPD